MKNFFDGLIVDLCLRLLRMKYRLVVVVVEDAGCGHPWARYGVRAGKTTVSGACAVSETLRIVADQLYVEAETAVIINRIENGQDIV